MEKFTRVPPKITAHGLQHQPIDVKRGELIEEHKKKNEDQKHFIKANLKGVRQTQMEFNVNAMATNAVKEKKRHFETKDYTKVPAYLRRYRHEEELDRQQTRREIEMNKRPPGTRVVTADEKRRALEEMHGRKTFCEQGIKNMSVTLYTNRA